MDSKAIHEQVARILRSTIFAPKNQLKRLLEILVRNIERPSDLNHDRVIQELWPAEMRTKRPRDVATEMNRLRHALETYYQREGLNDPIRIYLPNRATRAGDGSPEIRWIAARAADHGANHSPIDAGKLSAIRPAWIWQVGLAVAGAALICVVGFTTVRHLVFHPKPQFGRLDGSVLRIMGADGKELWTKTFPDGFGPDWYYASNMGPRLWFQDLEDNGETSVLFAYSPASPQPRSTTLICYSSRGKEKWRWTPGRELPELAGSPATYRIFALEVLKRSPKAPARIVVASPHAIWWPSQIALLDTNGKLISEYWHSGALTGLALADLDGDGRQEIIATGVANGYDHQATLVVLDPSRVVGASKEVNSEFQIHGQEAGQERLRLLFPRSDLNRALYQYNQATEPTFDQGHLRLTVTECITPPGCRIWYEFDKNFRLAAAYAGGDEFRSAHNRYFQTGKQAHLLSDDEQRAFQRIRCLKGCASDFVPVGELVP